MALEVQYDSKDKIPEGLAEHYTERDGVFVLQANGVKTQQDFDKFEDAITKRLSETRERLSDAKKLIASYGGMTPEEIEELKEKANGKGGGDDDKNKQIKLSEHPEFVRMQEELAELKNEKKDLETDRAKRDVKDAVMDEATKPDGPKIVQGALSDLVKIAQDELEVTGTGIYTREGLSTTKAHRTVEEWLNDQFSQRRYLFEGSKSGGADGGDGGGGGTSGKDNPYSKDGWNITKQVTLQRTNPDEAKRLREAVGVKPGQFRPPEK